MREIQPFVARLNDLMERIAVLRHRERQFLAHAAHELRTPLTELHATADVALLDPRVSAGHAEALSDMLATTRRAARLVTRCFASLAMSKAPTCSSSPRDWRGS